MATKDEIERLKKACEEARKLYEKAKEAQIEAVREYLKTKTKKSLHALQETQNALKVAETVYNKLLDDFIKAMAEFIVEKEKAQARKNAKKS